jgi:hypothetical protein
VSRAGEWSFAVEYGGAVGPTATGLAAVSAEDVEAVSGRTCLLPKREAFDRRRQHGPQGRAAPHPPGHRCRDGKVTVKDVDTCGTFDEASRRAILQTGSRACHSAPLISRRGTVIGMISSHHDQPLRDLGSDRLAALDQFGRQVGRWLIWHRNTTVITALNHIHTIATR